MNLPIKLLDERAIIPRHQSEGAAGLDLHACLHATVVLGPGERRLIPTGIAVQLPIGLEGQIRPRSGLACNHMVTVLNAPGTIDSDYRGEVMVLLINLGRERYTIHHGERIAQLVVTPYVRMEACPIAELTTTARGVGGLGSTGGGE